jgi:hypothetical protein
MRKFLASAVAALTFGGAVLATATPADAQYRYRRHRDNDGDVAAAAIVAGVAGLALGSALSSSNRSSRGYYSNSYYGSGYAYDPRYDRYSGGYYARPYGYAYAPPRICSTRQRVWDPYYGGYVRVRREYYC